MTLPQPPLGEDLRRQLRLIRRQRLLRLAAVVCFSAFMLWCLHRSGVLDLRWIANASTRLQRIIPESLPPDFSRLWSHWPGPLWETVVMSISGTFLGILLALPLGILAARRWSPHRLLPLPVRSFLGAMRTVPELLLAVVLVIAVGPGMLAGTLALALHSGGMLGKFYHEIMEHVEEGPVAAVRSCGGSRLQVWRYGVIAQVFPQFVDVTMFRWECNVRAALVLGIIGAGGIGQELIIAMRVLRYQEALGLVLIMLALVIAVDVLSGFIRKRLT